MTVAEQTIPIYERSYAEISDWWEQYVKKYDGWYLLHQPSPILLTEIYARSAINGEFPVSQYIKLACQRFLNDLEKSKSPDYPWKFDEELAYRPIQFMEKRMKVNSKHDPFVAQPFQHFIIGNNFGWVDKKTNARRFTESIVFMGRKNGKSTLVAGESLYATSFDNEPNAESYVLANSQQQSKILFNMIVNTIKYSPWLSDRFKIRPSIAEIVDPKSDSIIRALSAEKGAKDGLNTSFAVFDEIHEYKDYDLMNVISTSTGQRDQPLIQFITTAGFVLDGPLMDMYQSGKETLENYDDNLNERTFYYLAAMDNEDEIKDVNLWMKANPNFPMMNGIKTIDNWVKGMNIPEERSKNMTKIFNLFRDTGQMSFLDADTILSNNKSIDESRLKDIQPVGGFDLSDTQDFTAADIEFPLTDTGEVYTKVHSWIPKTRYDNDQNKGRLDKWVEEGDLTVIPGKYVDYTFVYDWFVEMDKKYHLKQINYDRRNSLILNEKLKNYGFDLHEVVQGFKTLNGPMKAFQELMLDRKVIFNNSPMFKWYLSNVKLVTDRNGNYMPTKQSKNRKIDGFAAVLDSHETVWKDLVDEGGEPTITFVSLKQLKEMI